MEEESQERKRQRERRLYRDKEIARRMRETRNLIPGPKLVQLQHVLEILEDCKCPAKVRSAVCELPTVTIHSWEAR